MGILIILVSTALSFIMTKYIEEPIRNSANDKFSFKRLAIMGSINLALIGALVLGINLEQKKLSAMVADDDYPGVMAVYDGVDVPDKEAIPDLSQVNADLPQSNIDGYNQTENESDLKIGEYGKTEDYDATIALIGSSTTAHWYGALIEATRDHNFRILNITRDITRFSTIYSKKDLRGIWNQNVLDYLKDAEVDLVISQSTSSNAEDDKESRGMLNQLQYVENEYDVDVLALRDVPRFGFNTLESLEIEGVDETSKKMNKVNVLKDESIWKDFVDTNSSIYKLDLSEYFKVNGNYEPIIGNIVVSRDGSHITDSISKSFGPILEEEIVEILTN